jgi:hypothetical protein
MIRFVGQGSGGQVLGLGLSFGNLDLLAEARPIRFDLAPYGESGHLLILAGTEDDVAAALATGDKVLGLTPRTLDSLRQGQVIPIELAGLGISALWQAILFAGPSERQILDDMRQSGLVSPDARIDTQDFERHERGEAHDCVECAPPPDSPVPAALFTYQQSSRWKPFVFLAVLVLVAIVLGILLAPSAGPR